MKMRSVAKTKPLRRWIVTRVVHEYFEVVARTAKEAKDEALDPHSVSIKQETAVLHDDQTGIGNSSFHPTKVSYEKTI